MAASNSDDSQFDKLVKAIKDRPVIARVLVLCFGVIALGHLSGALESILNLIEKRLLRSAPSEQTDDPSSPPGTERIDTAVPVGPTSISLSPVNPDHVIGDVKLIFRSPTPNEIVHLGRQDLLDVRGEISMVPTIGKERIARSVLLVVRSSDRQRVLGSDRSPVTEEMTWRISLRPNLPQNETDALLEVYLEGSDGRQLATSSRKITLIKEEQQ